MIPFLPFLAIYAGYALAEIKMKQIVIAVASIVMIEGFLNQQHDLAWYSRGAYKLNLEAEINAVIEPELPIAFISEGSPNEMYFANRSGWLVGLNQVYEEDLITRLKNEGCNYIILIKEQVVYRKVVLDYPIHFETNSLRFYRIN